MGISCLYTVQKFAYLLHVLGQRPEVPDDQVQRVRGEEAVVCGLITLVPSQIPHTQLYRQPLRLVLLIPNSVFIRGMQFIQNSTLFFLDKEWFPLSGFLTHGFQSWIYSLAG